MEGAKAQVIGTPFLQFHKSTYNINDIDTAEYLLYGLLANQFFLLLAGKLMNPAYNSAIRNYRMAGSCLPGAGNAAVQKSGKQVLPGNLTGRTGRESPVAPADRAAQKAAQ